MGARESGLVILAAFSLAGCAGTLGPGAAGNGDAAVTDAVAPAWDGETERPGGDHGVSVADRTVALSCTDGLKNQNETDADCGGSCPKCANGKSCLSATDCTSAYCNPSKKCAPKPPSCTDGLKNQNETDVDCGGSCPKCANGKSCGSPADCQSAYCSTVCVTDPCPSWSGPGSTLQGAVSQHACVTILPGTYAIDLTLSIPPGHTVRGQPGQRANTIIQVSDAFDTTDNPLGRSTMVAAGNPAGVATIAHVTLDGRKRAVRIIGFNYLTIDDVVVVNAVCDGVDINGPNFVLKNSEVAYNALGVGGGGICNSAAAPYGGGVYCQGLPTVVTVNAQIVNNTIHDNFGMGIDINGCHHGTISGNNVYNNNGPAAISLYGSSNWTVSGNTVAQPYSATFNSVFHPYCAGGPIGAGSAALSICQDTDANGFYSVENTVTGNKLSGKYGILSIGADEVKPYWAPRKSLFQSNDLMGSAFGCADDFKPGQWYSDDNIWSGNNCGSATGAPAYF